MPRLCKTRLEVALPSKLHQLCSPKALHPAGIFLRALSFCTGSSEEEEEEQEVQEKRSPPKPKLLRATIPCLNSVGSVTTLRMPSFRPALLGLGVLKCRLPGSVWCSYDSSTLIRAANKQDCRHCHPKRRTAVLTSTKSAMQQESQVRLAEQVNYVAQMRDCCN